MVNDGEQSAIATATAVEPGVVERGRVSGGGRRLAGESSGEEEGSQRFSDAEDRSWHSHSRQGSALEVCISASASISCDADAASAGGVDTAAERARKSCVSECSLDDDVVDLEAGLAEITKASPDKGERNCRICHLGLDSAAAESGAGIVLGCSCKADLSRAHKQCAETWFKIRGNNTFALRKENDEQRQSMPLYRPLVSPMARINVDLPSHIARGLFFALRRVGGVRRGPIRHHGHHGQRRSVFERLGPRLRRTAAHGHGHGPYGRIFDSAVRDVRADVHRRRWSPIRRGRIASPQDRPLQSQPPSPRLGADGAGPSNTAPPAVEVAAPPIVEAPMPLAEAVEMMPAAAPTPSYMPMEPMSPVPAPSRYWCDFCKEYTSIPHTLMPTPTPPTPMAPGNGVPPLDPWFLNTQAAPALDAVKVEDEVDVVAAPGVGNLFNLGDIFNTAARTGISPYFFLDRAGPSAPPPPATRAEAAARMAAQALPAAPPTPTEGTTTTTPSIRRLLGRSVAAVDRRPGIRRGSRNPATHGLPSAATLNELVNGSGFYSPDEGESSSN